MKMPLGFSLVPLLSLPCSQGLDSLNRVSSVFIRHNELLKLLRETLANLLSRAKKKR